MGRQRFRWVRWATTLLVLAGTGAGIAWYLNRSHGKSLALPKDQREFLWQVEHHGLVLNKNGFKPLASALRRADREALQALMAADFSGEVVAHPHEVRLDGDYALVVRREDAGGDRATLDRDRFADELLKFRRHFQKNPKVQINLMKLSPAVREDLDSPWEGTCQVRMYGDTGGGNPGEVVLHVRYRVDRPSEESYGGGGWLHGAGILQSLEGRSKQGFLLQEVSYEHGIDNTLFHDNWKREPKVPNTGGVYLLDFNRDGILDILVVDVERVVLYQGLPGGQFKDVTAAAGLPSGVRPPVAAVADLDGDGWEDLILGPSVYRNEAGKKFVDYTSRTSLRLDPDSVGVAVADYDRDGKVDLYVTRGGTAKADSWIDGRSGGQSENQLWHNRGDWQFENVTQAAGAGGGHRSTFSAVWLDADNDGWPDLYVINEFGRGALLVNNRDGTFREQDLGGPGDFGSMGVTSGDIDNDGRTDLFVANMYSKAGTRVIGNLAPGSYPDDVMHKMRQFVAGSQLYRNRGNLDFEPLGQKFQVAAVGWSWGPALVDLDNDGWLDLYATCGFISQAPRIDAPDG